jgi:methionyl-tRNA formyltransferase
MGSSKFAVPILEKISESKLNVSVVYTQPPKKSSRGMKVQKTPIQVKSELLGLPVRAPSSLKNNIDEYNFIKKIKPLIVIVISYGQIIPKEFLELSEKGFFNIHASILPKFRGAAPIQRAIMSEDTETGISFMKINEHLDTGPIVETYKIKIDFNLNATELEEKLSQLAAEKIVENINNIIKDKMKLREQDHSEATYAEKINKKEGKIIWNDSAKKIIGKINGLHPNPGAFFIFNVRFR